MSEELINYDNESVLKTIRETVAKGASPSQFAMFIEVCKSTGLNPFLKEIWFIPKTSTIMASRDGYLRKANESPNFDGMETRVERNDKDIPIKATCTVWRKDRGHPITCEAFYNEYKKDSPVWKQYPSAMISKVAEVLALKRSFAINGVVTEEEIGDQREPPKIISGGPNPSSLPVETKIEYEQDYDNEIKEGIAVIKGQEELKKLIEKHAGDPEYANMSKTELTRFAFDIANITFDEIENIDSLDHLRGAYKRLVRFINNKDHENDPEDDI